MKCGGRLEGPQITLAVHPFAIKRRLKKFCEKLSFSVYLLKTRNSPATEGNPNRKTSRTQKLIDHVQSKNGLTRQQDGPVRNMMT